MEQENKYTNKVANKFKIWSKYILRVGDVVLVAGLLATLASGDSFVFTLLLTISAIGIIFANYLFILAIAEVIQKLQNIEDNTSQ